MPHHLLTTDSTMGPSQTLTIMHSTPGLAHMTSLGYPGSISWGEEMQGLFQLRLLPLIQDGEELLLRHSFAMGAPGSLWPPMSPCQSVPCLHADTDLAVSMSPRYQRHTLSCLHANTISVSPMFPWQKYIWLSLCHHDNDQPHTTTGTHTQLPPCHHNVGQSHISMEIHTQLSAHKLTPPWFLSSVCSLPSQCERAVQFTLSSWWVRSMLVAASHALKAYSSLNVPISGNLRLFRAVRLKPNQITRHLFCSHICLTKPVWAQQGIASN